MQEHFCRSRLCRSRCSRSYPPKGHVLPTHHIPEGNGFLTFILELSIKARAAMILFPVFCQNVSASSSVLGLKVIFWPRK